MTHENQRKPVPPVFAGRVDHGCGCPLGFILGMGCVLLGMRHYGWPPWVALLLFLPDVPEQVVLVPTQPGKEEAAIGFFSHRTSSRVGVVRSGGGGPSLYLHERIPLVLLPICRGRANPFDLWLAFRHGNHRCAFSE